MSDYSLRAIHSGLTLAAAQKILDETLKAGRTAGLLPLTVAVLDSGGHLVAFAREDGCGTARHDIAAGKAGCALGMGMSSRLARDRLKERIAFQATAATATGGSFIPVPGGVLILNGDGVAIGAVGVSGDASDRDEYAAITGIQEAGFACDPAEPAPDWGNAPL